MPTFNIDGQSVDHQNAQISVMDHGLLYGDGVFEGLRFYDQSIFAANEHLDRLQQSAAAIKLDLPRTNDQMLEDMMQCIEASKLNDGYIRLLVTRGQGPLGIDPSTCSKPRTIIILDQLALVDPVIVHFGAKVITAQTRRFDADQLDPRIKSLNYLNQIMARQEATLAGAHEAILLNKAGRVAEGSADNIFIVCDGLVKTPLTDEGALDGITRKAILKICELEGIPAEESQITPEQLAVADECFLTGTGAELIPVASIDEVQLQQQRPTFDRLQKAFHRYVRQQTDRIE